MTDDNKVVPIRPINDPATTDSKIDRMVSILAREVPLRPSMPPILAEALAVAFTEARYANLRKAITGFPPLAAAALAVSILDYLPADEKDNFGAFLRRIARE